MNTSSTPYLVVVHGMGEQRPNSTIIPVIEQVARALCHTTIKRQTVPCGILGTTTEFSSCVKQGDKLTVSLQDLKSRGLFSQCDFNYDVHFAEFCWADILNKHFSSVGQPVAHWLETVIGRYEQQSFDTNAYGGKRMRKSNLTALTSLERTIDVANRLMTFRSKGLSDLAFGKYLGDVQVYNEYPECRRQAIACFHSFMRELYAQHKDHHPHIEPDFIIIAHSLGSVLSMESLICAHATMPRVGTMKHGIPHIPSAFEDNSWKNHVSRFVTLGSPIDKCLTLWRSNYEYIVEHPLPSYTDRDEPIIHDNYGDEQDPVGQTLTVFSNSESFKQFFVDGRDQLYTKSVLPGVAHMSYWNDTQLWRKILTDIGCDPQITTSFGKKVKSVLMSNLVYFGVLFTAYFLVPAVIAGLMFFCLKEAITAESRTGALIPTILFCASGFIGAQLISLFVWWRESLLKQGDLKAEAVVDSQRFMRKVYRWLVLGAQAFMAFLMIGLIQIWAPNEIPATVLGYLPTTMPIAIALLCIYYVFIKGRLLEPISTRIASLFILGASIGITGLFALVVIQSKPIALNGVPTTQFYNWLFVLLLFNGLMLSILRTVQAKMMALWERVRLPSKYTRAAEALESEWA
ncbi:MAG TPA: hypothetical protein VFH43_01290, partial [Candidatus Kapabacteria bacterium]|nr:hypothetical protein [Candidatus Kapabacteria bacterium]